MMISSNCTSYYSQSAPLCLGNGVYLKIVYKLYGLTEDEIKIVELEK